MSTFAPFFACTTEHELDCVLETLRRKPNVSACLLLGSTAAGVSDWSDYDLLVVADFDDPLTVEFTYVDGRASDVILVSQTEFSRLLRQDKPSGPSDCDVLSWISGARVTFTNVDEFAEAPTRAASILNGKSVLKEESFCRWVEANHILLKVRRYLASPKNDYRDGLEILISKAIADLPQDFLSSRGHRWLGDKDAMKIVRELDGLFADRVIQALHASSLSEKCAVYEELVVAAIAPAGPMWNMNETAGGWFRFSGTPESRSLWEELLADSLPSRRITSP